MAPSSPSMARRANDLLLKLTGRQLQKPSQPGRSPVAEKRRLLQPQRRPKVNQLPNLSPLPRASQLTSTMPT